MTLTRTRLENGVWEGVLQCNSPSSKPRLLVRHLNNLVGEAVVALDEASAKDHLQTWRVRVELPLSRISDGIQTFIIEDFETGLPLGHETIFAGEPNAGELQAEVALLRAELDLLKSAFRRHCRDD